MLGESLGHYRIEDKLGAGGMGVVYRATDTKLGRQVAIKVLPESYAQDPDRRTRFEREARVLAGLSHQNIAGIHGLEESNGINYLVLELVPGQTLAERLADGALDVGEALRIGSAIAEAMENAHERGIIHRDLKPANVKVTPEGSVKVLDFGLAKAFRDEPSAGGNPSLSPTRTMEDSTRTGVILGTAAYMSPEQARGKPVDKRTDVWSFGCVLYELLSGRRAFYGETTSDYLVAILGQEPDWSALPNSTPASVRALLHRCLQKEPQKRLRDMGDARIELEEALAGPSSGVDAAVEAPPVPARRWLAGALAGVLLGALVTVGVARGIWPPAAVRPVARFSVPIPTDSAISPSHAPWVAISPDGSRVAYASVRNAFGTIYVRSLDHFEPTPIADVVGHSPFFSPDGKWLGFYTARTRTLRKVALTGGAPVNITDVESMAGASWGEDGNIVWAWFDLFSVPAAGGASKTLLKVDINKGERFFRLPQHLPGGQAILFTIGTGEIESFEDGRIAVLDLKTGRHKTVLEGGSCARYSPTGHLVYARGGNLFAVPFDVKKLVVTGQPFPVLEGVFSSRNTGVAAFSISTTGDLVYASGPTEGGRRLPVWVDRQGKALPFNLPMRSYLHPRLAPGEKQLAVEIEGPAHDIFSYDLDRGVMTRLSFDGASHWPMWSPQGDRIAFRSWKTGGMTLWWMPADRSAPEELLPGIGRMLSPESWSPDGKTIAYLRMDQMTNFDVWTLPLDGDRKARPLLESKFSEASPKFSPDGKWLAYCSSESGRPEVFVTELRGTPFGAGAKFQVSTDGGTDPIWRRQGGELYYRSGDKMMAVAVATQPKLTLSRPHALWEGQYLHGAGASCGLSGTSSANYDVTGDGQRFLMIDDKDRDAVARQINVVLNWAEELKRLAAGKKI